MARFWIGVALCIPAVFVVGALSALPSMVAGALNLPDAVTGLSTLGVTVAVFALVIVGLVKERTRFFVVGMLAGLAILFVVAAGACVLLLAGLGSGS